MDRELEEELRFHLDERMEEWIREGCDPEEARARALRHFGDYDAVLAGCRRHARARTRSERWTMTMDGWRQDLALAVRNLRRRPRFSLTVAVTLALALGATTAVLTVVDGVLLRPLPYPEPGALVRVEMQNSPTNRFPLSAVDFQALGERQQSFVGVSGFAVGESALTGDDSPEWVRVGHAAAGLFETLGLEPTAGRVFRSDEDAPGAPGVALLTWDFARARFGGEDPLGRTLSLDGEPYTVVGVLPPGSGEIAGARAAMWVPLRLSSPERRGPFFIRAVARLRDDTDLATANRNLADISQAIFPLWASSFQDANARLTARPLREALVGDTRPMLLVIGAAVLLVLAIACANVANLVLARTASRTQELGIRSALGSTRTRTARLFLVEGMVLSLLGGLGAVGLSLLGMDAFRAAAPDLPRAAAVTLGARGLVALLVGVVVCGIILAAAPLAVGAARRAGWAPSGARGTSRESGGRLRHALVVVEFALALPLLAGATLLLGSLLRLSAVDPGFDPAGRVAIRITLPDGGYADSDAIQGFWDEALRRVRALPGVAAAGISASLPPDAPATFNNFDLLDRPVAAGASQPVTPWAAADDGFFKALGVPLEEGRMFDEDDAADAPPVVLVSRSWARHYYPGESPLGRRMYAGGCTSCPPLTVVGVVGDVKYQGLSGAADAIYTPPSQEPWRTFFLVVRAESEAAVGATTASVRRALADLDPLLPLGDASTLDERVHASLSAPRHWTAVVSGFAAAAALLAAIGVFGVLSWAVRAWTGEIGVRMALGADGRGVLLMVLRRGMTPAVLGTLLGLGLAVAAAPALDGLLFGVGARDPVVLAGATAILLCVAVAACLVPARRAARLDPVRAIGAD